jgi:predicted enzyme related to lactoylglutathione lyase
MGKRSYALAYGVLNNSDRKENPMANVTHFEIRADVPHRAANFYSKVFGWGVRQSPARQGYWGITTGGGPTGVPGGLTKRSNRDAVILRFDVPSIDEALKTVLQNGGKVVAPKKYVAGSGIVAYCHDTEGNTFEMIEKRP